MPPQAQGLENQEHFSLGIQIGCVLGAPSHPAQVLFLGEQPSPRVLWQEMGESLFMTISIRSAWARSLGDEVFCYQREEG